MTSGARTRHWGGELLADGRASFRVWAPGQERLSLRAAGVDRPMARDAEGWFELEVEGAAPGLAYAFELADGRAVPDPASRAQAGDVHGPSLLVDPKAYRWRTEGWAGRPWEETVVYELHVGAFTPQGTLRAAIDKLPHLARLGVTAIEVMPVAQFGGSRGWGYDGVLLYAPHNAYGSPDDFREFVDAAHSEGMSVLLDVVYNHFGPDGNYLPLLAPPFFDAARRTPWGASIAYHRPPVRRFFVENALYWLAEFRLDGFRFDAIDQVRDPESDPEILVEIAETLRAAFPGRPLHLTTEDNRNIARLHERGAGGTPRLFSGEWNDDFHNAAHVLATGETDGYYEDFAGDPLGRLARCLAEGFAYQGERSAHADAPRGEPSAHLPPSAFVDFLQNHDQIGNRAMGERLGVLADPRTLGVLSAILCLSPHVPLLFMGEEWGEDRPFLFFTDFGGELADAVRDGRRREFARFAAFAREENRARIPDPNAPETFEASRLDWGKAETNVGAARIERLRRLLAIRRDRIAPLLGRAGGRAGRVIEAGNGVLAVDWRLGDALLSLRANLGDADARAPAPDGDGFGVLFAEPPEAADMAAAGLLPAQSAVWALAPPAPENGSPLDTLSARHGIAGTYVNMDGSRAVAPDETLRQILSALGVAAGDDAAVARSLARPAEHRPPRLEPVAGARCFLPPFLQEGRAWGIALQVYELRSARNWGIGDLADLADLSPALAAAGADFVGVNPLHALFAADPARVSPFSPSNRQFLNPIYLAPDRLPFFAPDAGEDAEAARLRETDAVDYAAVSALKRRSLRRLWAAWRDASDLPADWSRERFAAFRDEGGEALARHALFETLSARMAAAGEGAGWPGWPEPLRDAASAATQAFAAENADAVAFEAWLQWLTRLQLDAAQAAAQGSGMRIGLYLDFAVGEAPDGSASWSAPHLFAQGSSLGAPPDMFTADGQDWGLAPLSPAALRKTGFARLDDILDALMRSAGALRIDHAMGLWQLFFVPVGGRPAEGAYVRYPLDQTLSRLAARSQAHRTLVVGEDLGNVPPGFRTVMREAGVLSYRILYFELRDGAFIPPADYPPLALACLSTHDLPTWEGFWRGDDIGLREAHGLIDSQAAAGQRDDRAGQRRALVEAFSSAGALDGTDVEAALAAADQPDAPPPLALAVAAHRFVAKTPSLLVAARLADLVGETRPTNLPGTVDAYPNWRLKLSVPIEAAPDHPAFRAIAAALRAERPRR